PALHLLCRTFAFFYSCMLLYCPSFFLLSLFSVTVSSPTAFSALSLHDALPICFVFRTSGRCTARPDFSTWSPSCAKDWARWTPRSEEHTSELQSSDHLVCRLLLEKKKIQTRIEHTRDRRRRQRTAK